MNPVSRGKTTHFSSDFCVAAEITLFVLTWELRDPSISEHIYLDYKEAMIDPNP